MAIYQFTRHPENIHKGQEVVLKKYVFVDGVLAVHEDEGKLYEPILCGYYGCVLKVIPDEVVAPEQNLDPSLVKAQTQTGAKTEPAAPVVPAGDKNEDKIDEKK